MRTEPVLPLELVACGLLCRISMHQGFQARAIEALASRQYGRTESTRTIFG
jgi:hypothetical protein